MKRFIFTTLLLLSMTTLAAQNYIVVNSEKIFKSIDAYNAALTQLDELARQYQQQVDNRYEVIEQLYQNYMAQKASLSASVRQSRETDILEREKEAQEYQESIFGSEGTLMKKRQELIQPIQKRVFDAIENYAKQAGADAVLDASNNPTLLYSNPRIDRTQQVIDALK